MIIKSKIFLIVLIAIANHSFAQSYESIFGTESTEWNVILFGACDYIVSHSVLANGDTTIEQNNYKIIEGLGGFLREDTVLGKVWFYNEHLEKEYLVMNLDLNLKDTFDIYNWSGEAIHFTVDSVYYRNDLKHIRINASTIMCSFEERITFIEGSGTTASFNYQGELNGNSVDSYMLCHHKNGEKVAGNILFNDTCSVYGVGIEDKITNQESIKIFPNPASDIIEFDLGNIDFDIISVKIYNALGKPVMKDNIRIGQNQINTSKLDEGIYFINFEYNNYSNCQRFIIQK